MLKYPLRAYLFHYGLKAGLPFGLLKDLNDICDAGRRPGDYLARRRKAVDLLRYSDWRGFLPREKGHRLFGSSVATIGTTGGETPTAIRSSYSTRARAPET